MTIIMCSNEIKNFLEKTEKNYSCSKVKTKDMHHVVEFKYNDGIDVECFIKHSIKKNNVSWTDFFKMCRIIL